MTSHEPDWTDPVWREALSDAAQALADEMDAEVLGSLQPDVCASPSGRSESQAGLTSTGERR